MQVPLRCFFVSFLYLFDKHLGAFLGNLFAAPVSVDHWTRLGAGEQQEQKAAGGVPIPGPAF